jgi:hypothetical protein
MEDFRLRFRRRKPPEKLCATLSLMLTALKECADAFPPPLKGAVGAVVHIRDLRLVRSPLNQSKEMNFIFILESQIKSRRVSKTCFQS